MKVLRFENDEIYLQKYINAIVKRALLRLASKIPLFKRTFKEQATTTKKSVIEDIS